MASSRTRKRKQQRQALKARRMCPKRPPRFLTPMERIMREMYLEVTRQMFTNDDLLLQVFTDTLVPVSGKPYTYALSTNKKPSEEG